MKVHLRKNLLLRLVTVIIFACGLSMGATHTVKKSETCYSISQKYKVSVDSLMAANRIKDPRDLMLGQRLTIPAKGSRASSTTAKISAKVSRTVAAPSKKSLRVVIDAGHGGRDRGAVWGGVRESDLNLRVAYRVESALKAKGYNVTMTRRSDVYVSLSRRAQIANHYGNSIFVSIHFNASTLTSVRGAETFYVGSRGSYLAKSIQSELVKNLQVRNRGYRYRRYSVLQQTSCPAVLVECGFISNSYERARCKTTSYQAAAARSIVSGIERYDRYY
jgi:N-acetylmuramoyl-L-alanine amidase